MEKAPLLFVIEDDIDDRSFVKEACRKKGIEVVTFDSGKKFFSYIQINQIQPFAILSDLNMPDINGFELWDYIKKIDLYEQTPFYIYSSDPNPTHISAAKLLGIKYYYGKPFNFEGYFNLIDDLSERSGLRLDPILKKK